MKLLLVKTSSLGDVIHTLPALGEALAARPGLAVDWVVEPAFADAVRLHGGVGRIWPAPIRQWRRHPFAPATWRAVGALRRELRAARYDLVLDAQGLLKSALVSRLAGRPVAGLDRRSARGGPVAALYATRIAVPTGLHAIDRTRLLFGAALGYAPDLARLPSLPPLPVADTAAAQRRAFLLHGTTWPSKAWPLAQWITLARALAARGYDPTLTYATPAEEAVARAVAAAVPACTVLPRMPLEAVARLIAASAVVIGVDTGLLHLAAAAGRPTVALFGPTAPGLTGPRGPAVTVLAATTPCAPCRQRRCPLVPRGSAPPCHATIGPARVLALLDDGTGRSPTQAPPP